MKNFRKLIQLFFVIVFLTSCKTSVDKEKLIKNPKETEIENITSSKNKMEVKYSCENDGIKEYLDDGWIIIEEYSEEKICTWKSYPATKDCDMEKDKGCKITMPDKIGEEKVYLLEK